MIDFSCKDELLVANTCTVDNEACILLLEKDSNVLGEGKNKQTLFVVLSTRDFSLIGGNHGVSVVNSKLIKSKPYRRPKISYYTPILGSFLEVITAIAFVSVRYLFVYMYCPLIYMCVCICVYHTCRKYIELVYIYSVFKPIYHTIYIVL